MILKNAKIYKNGLIHKGVLFINNGIIKEIIIEEYSQEVKEDGRVLTRPLLRTFAVLEKMNQMNQIASEGIAKIVANLRRFVSLDEAEWQIADIHEGIDVVLAFMEPVFSARTIGHIRVTRDYGNIPKIFCCPSSLNQVFVALLQNASEAIDGEGNINIKIPSIQLTSSIIICNTFTFLNFGRSNKALCFLRIFSLLYVLIKFPT